MFGARIGRGSNVQYFGEPCPDELLEWFIAEWQRSANDGCIESDA